MATAGTGAQPFAPNKIHHLIYFMIRVLDREAGAIECMKLAYLIDVAFFRLFGRVIAGAHYFRHKRGPFAQEIADAAQEMHGHELEYEEHPSKGRSQYLKKACSPGSSPRFEPRLEPEEAEVIRRVLREIEGCTPRELEDLAYATEPMRAIRSQETRDNTDLVGVFLDMSLLQRDQFMTRWLANRARAKGHARDTAYERYLQKQRREFEELLSTL